MGRKCCVTNCNGNYNKNNKVRTFRLPRNESEKARWLSAIPRDNIPDSKDTVVCERHWPSNYATKKVQGKLRPTEPPTIFHCVKPSQRPTPAPPCRGTKRALSGNRQKDVDQKIAFDKADSISNYEELIDGLPKKLETLKCSSFGITETSVSIQSKDYVTKTGIPTFLLVISQDFSYQAFHHGIACKVSTLSKNRIFLLNKWSKIEEAIRFLKIKDVSNKTNVLMQQVAAMGWLKVGEKKYDPATIVRAFEYFALSRTCYQKLCSDFELPSICTLSRLTSSAKSLDDNSYLNNIFLHLKDPRQKYCILLLDEVYVKSTLLYHGGSIFGKAVNKPELLANTILCFMIVCLFNGPKLLHKMLPVAKLDADFLHQQTLIILEVIKKSGGIVKAVICDGNRVNQALFKKMSVDASFPWKARDEIFLLYDFVHILKNIRNNWITESTKELEYYYQEEIKRAKWSDIEKLYKLESQQLLKMSKLTKVAVYPNPIERQNVSCCLKVFSDATLSALRCHSEMQETEDTTLFIAKVLQFWNIVNVKSPCEDIRLRNENRAQIQSQNDNQLSTLLDFGEMAKRMYNTEPNGRRKKSFTKDTSNAIWHTCNGLVELCKDLLKTSEFRYVLLGNFTTDHLEKYFSKLRQGCGGTYFITVQQSMEKLAIHKTKLSLQLDCNNLRQTASASQVHSCEKCDFKMSENVCTIFDNLPDLESHLPCETKMALVYIAGYVSRHEEETAEDTFNYYETYGQFLNDINRGGLKIPRDSVCVWVTYGYIIFREIADLTCRRSLCEVLLKISEFYKLNVLPSNATVFANVLFKNYCSLYSPKSSKEPKQKILKLSARY